MTDRLRIAMYRSRYYFSIITANFKSVAIYTLFLSRFYEFLHQQKLNVCKLCMFHQIQSLLGKSEQASHLRDVCEIRLSVSLSVILSVHS